MTAALTSVGVQQVSITIPNGSTSNTATITTVGSGAFILWQGQTTTNSTTSVSALARIELTNTTTVTATRNTSSTDTVTVNAVVIDGDTTNLIKSVQSGTVTIASAATTGTASISAVTNANTAVAYLGLSTAASLSLTRSDADVTLSGTTVTATRGAATGACVVGFCVIEFQSAALNSSVQNVTVASTASGTTFNTTISSVTTANTFLIFSGQVFTLSASSARTQEGRLSLASSTSVQVDVNTAPSSTGSTYACCVVELVSGLLAQNIQRGTIALSAATSNTATITSAATAQTLVNWLNNSSNSAADNHATDDYRITQTNATTLTMTANTSATGTGSYEVITFNPASVATGFPIAWVTA